MRAPANRPTELDRCIEDDPEKWKRSAESYKNPKALSGGHGLAREPSHASRNLNSLTINCLLPKLPSAWCGSQSFHMDAMGRAGQASAGDAISKSDVAKRQAESFDSDSELSSIPSEDQSGDNDLPPPR